MNPVTGSKRPDRGGGKRERRTRGGSECRRVAGGIGIIPLCCIGKGRVASVTVSPLIRSLRWSRGGSPRVCAAPDSLLHWAGVGRGERDGESRSFAE